MELVKSIYIQQYVEQNKKEAEIVFPYIIKTLLINTVKNITKIDIPSGDDVIQTGFDGVIKFNSINKYLGDKPCKIEIGTDKDYVTKANKDIQKREADKEYNFVFFTPYKWNSRTTSKDKWISDSKKKYNWNDIIIVDAELLAEWMNEDFLSTKFLLKKMNINSKNIFLISEKELELKNKTIQNLDLNFFDYWDNDYKSMLSELKKDYYKIIAPTLEEGIYVTMFYLKELGYDDKTIIVDEQSTYDELVKSDILNNSYIIPNFYHNEELEIPQNNIVLLIYSEDEYINNYDYKINQRTINNLNNALQMFYKDDSGSINYEQISKITKKSLGKYMPLKREIFKTSVKPAWYDEINREIFLYLFYVNSFKGVDLKIFENFNLNISQLKTKLKELVTEKDPYIVYYKCWDEYKIVNVYNVIEWLGLFIDEENIEMFCQVVRKILFYLEPRYLVENINQTYYIEDSSKREFSKPLKNGVLKSLIITKLYLKRENKYSLYQKLDQLVTEYYESIVSEEDFLNFALIADELAEFDFGLYLNKISSSIGNEKFEKMFNLSNKDTLFSSNEYCHILWGIEKAILKREYIAFSIDILARLCEIKNSYYGNMANSPFNTLKYVFMGWDNLTCLSKDEKILLLEKLIKEHDELGRKLLIDILPSEHITWSDFLKPEFDSYDEIKSIKYVYEQKDFFEEYYKLYLNYYVKTLEDILPIFDEVYFVEFDCFEIIKNKALDLLKNSNDYDKSKLKRKISQRINGYEKYHNSAWDLSKKQYEFLCNLRDSIDFNNKIYDYLDLYDYHLICEDNTQLEGRKQSAFQLLKTDSHNIEILLDNCENKRNLLYDVYEFVHEKHYNLEFLKLLFEKYDSSATYYLDDVYKYESSEDILNIYEDLNSLDMKNRILILSNAGYDESLYEKVKDTKYEPDYWKKISFFRTNVNDFVYNSCLKYENYQLCLEYISKEESKLAEKCELLEKMVDSNYNLSQLEKYDINNVFNSFHNCSDLKILDRITKLEIYFNPILDNKTFFISKEASHSPSVVAEMVEILYKDTNGNSIDIPNKESVSSNCFNILRNLKIDFSNDKCFDWCDEFLKITKEKKRNQVSFHILGQLLAKSGVDQEDGMIPIKNVRNIIEHYQSSELNSSFEIAIYNQRGVHRIGIGEEEYSLYQKYLSYSNKMKFEYPETSKIMKSIADQYKNESEILREEANYVEG